MGRMYEGLRIKWPSRCHDCPTKQCQKRYTTTLGVCSFGFNYIWADNNFLIAGIVIRDFIPPTPAYRKQLKKAPQSLVKNDELDDTLKVVKSIDEKEILDIEIGKKKILDEYRQKQIFNKDILDEIEVRVKKAFSTLHDYKHFVSMVSQNMNVILETRYEGKDIDEKLEKASHAEKSIYFASKMMAELLNVNLYITNPESIFDPYKKTKFSLHGLVLKYVRIYQMAFEEHQVEVIVLGRSQGKVLGNPGAVGVIIHTFINNALKYSENGDKVKIVFNEDDRKIRLSVASHGPRIKEDEIDKIFEPFYRGIDAGNFKEEGTGFGLYASQFIAHQLGTKIIVEQSDQLTQRGYLTTFSVSFDRVE